MGARIRHAGIVVTEMEKALRFYRDLLGLTNVLSDSVVQSAFYDDVTGTPGARIRLVVLEAAGGGCVELLEYLSHPKAPRENTQASDIGCSHVAFFVDDIDQKYEDLCAAGVRFNCPPALHPTGYAKLTYCHDFDGTIVELVEIVDEAKARYRDWRPGQ